MEVINSFFKNVKDKLTNPYFGTLILVLLFHHWELLYSIFNFDDRLCLNAKLKSINKYISTNITFESVMYDALWALILMLAGYLIIVITRSIVLWVEFWLMPLITGKIINKNVVEKDKYDNVVKEREEYFDQYEVQRKNVRTFSKTIDEQTEQIKEKDKALLEQTKTISVTVKEIELTKSSLEKALKDASSKAIRIESLNKSLTENKTQKDYIVNKVNKFELLYFSEENRDFYSSIDKFPPEVITKLRELKKDNRLKAFLEVGRFYEFGGTMGGEIITEMINRELVLDRSPSIELSPVGKIIFEYRKVLTK